MKIKTIQTSPTTGFSLTELLITISIIAILTMIGIQVFTVDTKITHNTTGRLEALQVCQLINGAKTAGGHVELSTLSTGEDIVQTITKGVQTPTVGMVRLSYVVPQNCARFLYVRNDGIVAQYTNEEMDQLNRW